MKCIILKTRINYSKSKYFKISKYNAYINLYSVLSMKFTQIIENLCKKIGRIIKMMILFLYHKYSKIKFREIIP